MVQENIEPAASKELARQESSEKSARRTLSDEAVDLMRDQQPVRPFTPIRPNRNLWAWNEEDRETQLTRIETTRSLGQGVRDAQNSPLGGSASVTRELAAEMVRSVPDLTNPAKLKMENETILVAATNKAPAVLDSRLAEVTRPYEQRLVRILTGKDAEVKLTEEQRSSLSQGDLALLARKISPDTATAVLTLANFTKNITARMRNINEADGDNGISEEDIHDDQLRAAYSTENVEAIAAQVENVNGKENTGDSFSSGLTYHYYGALAASYFLRGTGSLAVGMQCFMTNDGDKRLANIQGAEAGMELSNHEEINAALRIF